MNKKNVFQNFKLFLVVFIWIGVLFIFPTKGFSQENIAKETKPYLKLSIGLGNYKFRDKVFSPLNYGGTSVPISFKYQSNQNKKIIHSISFFYDNFEATSSITRMYSWSSASYVKSFSGDFEYAIIKKVKPQFTPWFSKTHIGLGWRTFISIKDYQIIQNNSQTSRDFISSLNLDSIVSARI